MKLSAVTSAVVVATGLLACTVASADTLKKISDSGKITLAYRESSVPFSYLSSPGAPVGFALWFYNYSTFRGRHGIYLEDLFVVPEARGLGAGKALLRRLAQRCQDEGLARLEWSVLDWNAPAIGFYRRIGAVGMDEWTVQRLEGEALHALASHDAL